MIQLNIKSMMGAHDPRDGSLAAIGKKAAASFHHALSGALSATPQDSNTDSNQVSPSLASAVSTAPAVSPFSFAAATSNPSVTATSTSNPVPAAPAATGSASADSTQSFDDAYWAKQPPAVQALRNVDDYDQRMQMASKLTAQGYSIDVPIMIWGWDPAKITAARQSYGYTWVPSAMQAAITEAPGLSSPGVQAYDPKKYPDGCIAV